jgi:hypothetical protein
MLWRSWYDMRIATTQNTQEEGTHPAPTVNYGSAPKRPRRDCQAPYDFLNARNLTPVFPDPHGHRPSTVSLMIASPDYNIDTTWSLLFGILAYITAANIGYEDRTTQGPPTVRRRRPVQGPQSGRSSSTHAWHMAEDNRSLAVIATTSMWSSRFPGTGPTLTRLRNPRSTPHTLTGRSRYPLENQSPANQDLVTQRARCGYLSRQWRYC